MTCQYLSRNNQPDLAYVYIEGAGDWPTVFFCGGFRSDMEGTKATYLEEVCKARGQGYVRFDYSGHGSSKGQFVDGTIGSWTQDAMDVFDHTVKGPAVVVGSSMGGWISLLLARARPEKLQGVIGIAAAPDFTRGIIQNLSEEQRNSLEERGYFEEANEYSDDPYIFTKALLDDGAAHCLLESQQEIQCPVYLLQGKVDPTVHWETAVKIQEAFGSDRVEIEMIEDGDHSLSRPEDLIKLDAAVCKLSGS